MANVSPIAPAINAGEFSPRMAARTDFQKYPLACETLQNMIPLPQGGATRRPGTKYVVGAMSNSVKGRLVAFEVSEVQAYVLEFGANALRFYKDRGQIVTVDTDAAITNGTFASNITGWDDRSDTSSSIAHDATNQDMNLTSNGSGYAHAEQDVTIDTSYTAVEHVIKFQVKGTANDWLELRIGTTSEDDDIVDDVRFGVGYHCYAFTPGVNTFYVGFRHNRAKTVSLDNVSIIDNAAVEIASPYAEADLPELYGAQSANQLYLCHPDYPVYRLDRSGHASWSLTQVDFDDGPYLDANTTATTLTPSAATGLGITLTFSSTVGVNGGAGLTSAGDVGRLVRYSDNGTRWGYAIITAVTNATVATADVIVTLNATSARTTWRLGSWSGETGYPAVCFFHEQRFGLASTVTQPQTFWLSQSADPENMTPDNRDGSNNGSVEDDDAFDYTIAADQANAIRWAASYDDRLIMGTAGGEWTVTSSGAILKPTDIDVKRQTAYGSYILPPLLARGRLMFLQKAQRKLLEFAFSYQIDGYQSLDMTLLAEHITKGGIEDYAYQQELDSTIWCVRADGIVPTFTYQPDQNVTAWARQVLGGVFQGSTAVVDSVAVIPGNNRDEVWLLVKRTVNGSTVRYIEYLEAPFETGDEQPDAFYVDCGLTRDNPKTIGGATKADPVVVTCSSHGFSGGNEIIVNAVKGMTELNDLSFFIGDVSAGAFSLAGLTSKFITGATAANPVVITSAAHGHSNGDVILIRDVSGMTQINGNFYKVANKTADTFELNTLAGAAVNGSAYSTYTSGGTIHPGIDGTSYTTYTTGGEARVKTTSVTGLSHLEGQSLAILADGAVHPAKTVSSGAITLDYEAARVQAGLAYTHIYKTLKFEVGNPSGTAQGQTKRIYAVTLMLLDSLGSSVGPDTGNLKSLTNRDVTDRMDTAIPFFTGEKFIEFDGDYDSDVRMVVQGSDPVPFTLLAISPRLRVNPR